MRILLVTAGSRGDVEPFAALARRAAALDRSGADLEGASVAERMSHEDGTREALRVLERLA